MALCTYTDVLSSRFTEVGLLNKKVNPSVRGVAANLWALSHGAGGDSEDQCGRSLGDRAGSSLQLCVLGLSSEALVLLFFWKSAASDHPE